MAKQPCAGDLRHRITIQSSVKTGDGGGGFTVAWSNLATVRGKIEPLRGREQLHGMQLEARVTHRILIRYRSDVTAANRILFGTRTFNIRSVLNVDERNRWLEILAEEGVAT